MKPSSNDPLTKILSQAGSMDEEDQDLKLAQIINELDLSDAEVDDFIKQIETDIEYLISRKGQ